MRSRYAGQPFTTPTTDIAAALEQVSIPTLLLSLVHITGDPRFIRDFKPAGIFLNEVQGFMSEEDKARARAEALPVITDYRDRGCPEPAPLPPELIREMMDWAVCESVPDDYLALLAEEMDLQGVDPRRPAPLDSDRAAQVPVVVIGCGESGILAGIRLQQANIPFTIVEKNAGPGGTWWENSYPGARVDVANHFYCYSFEPSNEWSHFFAEQPELQSYFTRVMDKHGLNDHVRWQTEVVAAEWDDEDGMWTDHHARRRRGSHRRCRRAPSSPRSASSTARTSQSSRARTLFRGPSFHSAAWDHSVDLTGKRVALIGAGASGFQIAPGHRRRSRAPHRLSAHRTVDVSQRDVPRRSRRRRALGDGPPALLRALVPIPGAVARIRQGPRRRAGRPGLRQPGLRGQRDQCHCPPDVHRLDHQSG